MSFILKKLEVDELAAFLTNPFSKSAEFGDFIFQKYPTTSLLDEILAIHKDSIYTYVVGFSDYESNKIFVLNDYPLGYVNIEVEPFTFISNARNDLKESVINIFEKAKVDRLEEIESSKAYNNIYNFNKDRLMQKLIFTKLGADDCEPLFQSDLNSKVSKFFELLSVKDVINAYNGHLVKLDKFIEKIIFSDEFILTEVVFKKLEIEANDYIKAGVFTKREQRLIDYMKHTKPSGANNFTAYFVGGKKVRLKNAVTAKGYVTVLGSYEYCVDFEKIERIDYNGKTIYRKNNSL